jgi:hypothetical protein
MTQRSDRNATLLAEAGPRVRAPRKADLPDPFVRSDLHETPLPFAAPSMEAAANSVSALLTETAHRLRSWSLDRRDPVRHLTWLVPLATVGPLALVVTGVHWVWPAALAAGVVFGAMRLVSGLSHRVAVLSREISAELEHGVPPLQLVDEIETLIGLDPENDPARLLLAHVRVQQNDPLGALLQLAPLRDRHPDDGMVVLLAAVAYAALGAAEDAARMLDALQLDSEHPWTPMVRQFHEACRREMDAVRVSSDEFDLDV